jgi:hypothetical protein
MPPGMEVMPTEMADPMMAGGDSLNAGLMSTPQAQQELAAQDAMAAQMPQQIPMMASGGIVSFSEGGQAELQRRKDEAKLQQLRTEKARLAASPGGSGGRAAQSAAAYAASLDQQISAIESRLSGPATAYPPGPVRGRDVRALSEMRTRDTAAEMQRRRDMAGEFTPNPFQPAVPPLPSWQDQVGAAQVSAGPSLQDQAAAIMQNMPQFPDFTSVPMTGGGGGGRSNYQGQMDESLARIMNIQPLSEADLAAANARGLAQYEAAVPDRVSAFEQELEAEKAGLAGRRESNINEALMRAGLGMMSSSSPHFFQAVGEGATAGLDAYQKGMQDIRASERELMQSRISLANAQSLRDQQKYAAAQAEEQKSLTHKQFAIELANTQDATIARRIEQENEQRRIALEGARVGIAQQAAERQAMMDRYNMERDQALMPLDIQSRLAEIDEKTAMAGYRQAQAGAAQIAAENGNFGLEPSVLKTVIEIAAQQVASKTLGQEISFEEYRALLSRHVMALAEEATKAQAGIFQPIQETFPGATDDYNQ